MTRVFLSLGANQGQPAQNIKDAIVCFAQQLGITIEQRSSAYRTAPHEAEGDDYINIVLVIDTEHSPLALLAICQLIEDKFGRTRPYHHAPRTLDIDILLYGDIVYHDERLTLPHPRMTERAFVLVPLVEVAPDIAIPNKGLARQYLEAVASQAIQKLPPCSCPGKSTSAA